MTEFNLSFCTPEKVIFEGKVTSIIAHGTEGYLEILAHHAPIITTLQPGKIVITLEYKEKRLYAASEGFLEISDNTATLLVDTAELASDIDPDQAQLALEKAEKNLATESAEIDHMRAKKALARAKNRLKIYDDFKGQ